MSLVQTSVYGSGSLKKMLCLTNSTVPRPYIWKFCKMEVVQQMFSLYRNYLHFSHTYLNVVVVSNFLFVSFFVGGAHTCALSSIRLRRCLVLVASKIRVPKSYVATGVAR